MPALDHYTPGAYAIMLRTRDAAPPRVGWFGSRMVRLRDAGAPSPSGAPISTATAGILALSDDLTTVTRRPGPDIAMGGKLMQVDTTSPAYVQAGKVADVAEAARARTVAANDAARAFWKRGRA